MRKPTLSGGSVFVMVCAKNNRRMDKCFLPGKFCLQFVPFCDILIYIASDIKPFGCVKGATIACFMDIHGALLPHRKGCGNFCFRGNRMETRVAVMSIIVENNDVAEKLNAILHEYGNYIIGRMGIPYRKRQVNIISVALDAPQDTIAAMAGKIGSLSGITVKTAYSNVISTDE